MDNITWCHETNFHWGPLTMQPWFPNFALHNAKLATSSKWVYKMLLLKCEQRRIIFQAQHFFNNFLFGPFTFFVVVIISSRKDMKHLSKLYLGYSLTASFLLSYVRKETYIALVKKRPFYTANDTINSLQTRKSLRPIWG